MSRPIINARKNEEDAWEKIKKLMKKEGRSIKSFQDMTEKRELSLASFSTKPSHGMVPKRYQEYVLDKYEYSRRPGDTRDYHCCCTKPLNEWTFVTNIHNGNVLRIGLCCKELFLEEGGGDDHTEEEMRDFIVSDYESDSADYEDEDSDDEESAETESGDTESSADGSSFVADESSETNSSEESSEVVVRKPNKTTERVVREDTNHINKRPIIRIDLTGDGNVITLCTWKIGIKRKNPFSSDAHTSKRRKYA